ncbi:MAG: hypothetical protein QM496_16205 [Verrucomicrobiota bacterium]
MNLKTIHPNQGFTRRDFLQSSVGAAAATLTSTSIASSQVAGHRAALSQRKCRIVVQHDAYDILQACLRKFGAEQASFDTFKQAVFSHLDDPASQIDAIWWDINGASPGSAYPSDILPPVDNPLLKTWLADGVDWVRELVSETRKRKLEVFWNYRISEVDGLAGGGLAKKKINPLKAAHPDWLVPDTWWWQGMWNLASEDLRFHKIEVLHELVTRYDFNGIQIDFSRHMPCLPIGRQWEMREHVTEFMQMVRQLLDESGKKRGHPILLAAKVPRNPAGCRIDGFDLQAWADKGLIDILTLGSRSIYVEVEGFRKLVGDKVQLQPCFDDHHATDGYRHQSVEFLRGVFANHWQRGADSVVTFNWSTGVPEVAQKVGAEIGPLSQQVAYREIGDPSSMVDKDKIFAVERRGGYPWSNGFFNRNHTSPLPVILSQDKAKVTLALHISDDPMASKAKLTLRCILFGVNVDDSFEFRINNTPLTAGVRDTEWKDAQIFSPKRQPTSGGKGLYKINPKQQLLRLDCLVPNKAWRQGLNQISIHLTSTNKTSVQIEKLEAHLKY